MAVNINLARQKVEAVRTETEDFANTALRVGGAMSDILEYAHEEKLRAEESESTILRAVAQNAVEIRALKSGSATKGELLVEEERAKAAEQAIRDSVESLSDDMNAASEDISKLEVAIEAETNRAKAAEQSLSMEITDAENRVDERISEVRDGLEANIINVGNQLVDEIDRAKAADEALDLRVAGNFAAISGLGVREEGKSDGYEISLVKATNTADKIKAKIPVYDILNPEKNPVGLVDEVFVDDVVAKVEKKIPKVQDSTEEEIEEMIANGTWEEGVLYLAYEEEEEEEV